jgi:hypothetical protein
MIVVAIAVEFKNIDKIVFKAAWLGFREVERIRELYKVRS